MSNVRKKVKVTVIGALVAALASCGGGGNGDSEANKVEQVAKDYYSAFARGDAKTACDLQEQESEAERAGCEAGVKYGQELGQEVGGKLQETLTHVDIKNVRVSGRYRNSNRRLSWHK